MAAKRTHPSLPSAHPALAGGLLLLTVALVLGGCRSSAPPTAESPAPTTTAPATAPAAAPTAAPAAQPTPTTAPEPLAAQSNSTVAPTAPATAPAISTGTLPDTFIKEWQPLSNVLVAFGPMTLTPDQVQWGSGQTSPYSLVSTEGGYLLRLTANPGFYDAPTAYIKIIPKADANGAATSMDVAFYTDEAKLQIDEYVMYGSYFDE
ncbi:MAG: hypothetical protein ACOYM4_18075 [Nodosilinea sp.]